VASIQSETPIVTENSPVRAKENQITFNIIEPVVEALDA